jgi:hypothetical protein
MLDEICVANVAPFIVASLHHSARILDLHNHEIPSKYLDAISGMQFFGKFRSSVKVRCHGLKYTQYRYSCQAIPVFLFRLKLAHSPDEASASVVSSCLGQFRIERVRNLPQPSRFGL